MGGKQSKTVYNNPSLISRTTIITITRTLEPIVRRRARAQYYNTHAHPHTVYVYERNHARVHERLRGQSAAVSPPPRGHRRFFALSKNNNNNIILLCCNVRIGADDAEGNRRPSSSSERPSGPGAGFGFSAAPTYYTRARSLIRFSIIIFSSFRVRTPIDDAAAGTRPPPAGSRVCYNAIYDVYTQQHTRCRLYLQRGCRSVAVLAYEHGGRLPIPKFLVPLVLKT